MCDECRGQTETCPVCGKGDEDFEQELDDQLNAADDYNDLKREHNDEV